MKKNEMVEVLKSAGIEFDENLSKKEIEELIESNGLVTETEEEPVIETDGSDLVSKISGAIKKEVTVAKRENDVIEQLKSRPYGELTRGQRELLRQNSDEYVNVENGVKVKLNERLATEKRLVKFSNNIWKYLYDGKEYFLSEEDYNLLKDAKVKVKTKETEHLCCGRAKYESVDLLVVDNA